MTPIKHYPIEVIHWAGMNDECLDDLKNILELYPEYINTTNNSNDNALIIAVRTGNIAIVKYLINETNIDIHHVMSEGNVINVATETNRNEMIELLIEKGISPFVPNANLHTPLFISAAQGNDSLVELFLSKGANIKSLDIYEQNILFAFMNSYLSHNNYYCFEILQEQLPLEILFHKNIDGLDIIEYMNYLIDDAKEKNNNFRAIKLEKAFNPLYTVLMSRRPD